MLQLDPQIPLETPKGKGQAVVVIDYGPDHDLMWVVVLNNGGEIWTFRNPDVRGVPNETMGRQSGSS